MSDIQALLAQMVAAGEFPPPDHVEDDGVPTWHKSTLRAWMEDGHHAHLFAERMRELRARLAGQN